jgi:xylulokinase
MSEYTIAYDFGTGSVKAALVGMDYQVAGYAVSAYPSHYPEPGWVEQHPEDYWDSFIKVTKELLAMPCADSGAIRGLVFSQTSAMIIFLDKEGNSLYDCVTWIDGRADEEAAMINQSAGVRIAHEKSVGAKLLWFMRHRPDIAERADCMLDTSGYMFLKTTGEKAYEYTGANATWLYNKLNHTWDEDMFGLTGFPRRLIPERVAASTEIVGHVTEETARLTGLRAGTPVVGGCSDNANGQLGAGCVNIGDAHIYLGSSGWLSVTSELSRKVMPSAIPGMGFHYYCTNSVGTSIDWAVQEFYREEKARLGSGIYQLIGKEAEACGRERGSLIFTPWLYGEESPVADGCVRGSLLGLKPTTRRVDVIRAVIEGIGFNFRWMKEQHEAEFGRLPDELAVIGGAGQTRAVVQTISDIMGVSLTTLKAHRFAGNVGLTACVDIALGRMKDFSQLPGLLRRDVAFTPDPALKEHYDAMFEIYKQAYEGLKETYEALVQV